MTLKISKKKSPHSSGDLYLLSKVYPNLPEVEAITNAPKVSIFPIVK